MSRPGDGRVADAVENHWADTRLPRAMRPYARLARWERPIGWWLLLWPCWWGCALSAAADGALLPDPAHLALFAIGAIAMRGAGCTYNDIVDRDIDARVERTRSRPLVTGHVTLGKAIVFLLAQSLVGLVVLLQFNRFTILAGLASVAVIAVYPFAKRVSHYPQVVLGIAFSWGALLGWSARFETLDWPALLLFAGAVFWTIGYDTIYAHQDRADDIGLGIGSTALAFAAHTRPALVVIYGLAAVFFLCSVLSAGLGWWAIAGAGLCAVHFGWQIKMLDIEDSARCLTLFRSNNLCGWVFFLALSMEALARVLMTGLLRI